MNENSGFSNFNNGRELKCSLCKEALCTKKGEEMTQEVIYGSIYFFELKCFNKYKRLEDLYGKNIKNFIGNKQKSVFDNFWNKAIPTSDEI